MTGVEQGPIRPPSEARSLLVRVTRGCPWNRCAFCPVYKRHRYSARPTEEIVADLDAMAAAAETLRQRSREMGHGGAVTRPVLEAAASGPDQGVLLPVAWWLAGGGRTVFLQDANALASPRRKVLAVLGAIRERFDHVTRITTYSQTRTLARKPVDLLAAYGEAGLTRVHVGLESGSDAVLELMRKGATAATHVEGGRRVVAAGLHLCCYVMPGLGGAALSDEHAAETARVLAAIQPAAVRLRSLVISPGTPLGDLLDDGAFAPLPEADVVAEIRTMLAAMDGVRTRLVSDHDLNLLPELEGRLPEDLPALLEICDRFLAWTPRDQRRFLLGRRAGMVGRVGDLEQPGVRDAIDDTARRLGVDLDRPIDGWIDALRRRMV